MEEKVTNRVCKSWNSFRLHVPSFAIFMFVLSIGVVDIYFKYAYLPVHRHTTIEILFLGVLRSAPFASIVAILLSEMSKTVRNAVFIFLMVFVLVSAAEMWTQYCFHMALGGAWLRIIVNSSKEEIREFFMAGRNFQQFLSFVCLLLASGILLRWLSNMSVGVYKRNTIIVVIVGALCCHFAVSAKMKGSSELSIMRIIPLTVEVEKEERALSSCRKFDVPSNVSANKSVIGVLILGESATRNHMSLYGYNRITTPRCDAIQNELFVFTDFRANAIETGMAMRYMFTEATTNDTGKVGVTLSKLCKKTDTKLVLISNQGHWRNGDAIEDLLFWFAEKRIYIADLGFDPPVYDNAVISPFIEELDNLRDQDRVLFVVHLYGSHSPYDSRCPVELREFQDDYTDAANNMLPAGYRRARFNQYDNSIAFTDSIVAMLIDHMKKEVRPAFVVYLSDHGESPSASGWRVSTDKDCWQIPLIVWPSVSYRDANPDVIQYLSQVVHSEITSQDILNLIAKLLLINGYEKQH